MLNSLFRTLLGCARTLQHDPTKSAHALETLCILTRTLLAKNLNGWEIMEVFAGGTKESDLVFMSLTSLVEDYLKDDTIPGESLCTDSKGHNNRYELKASNRHRALQLALIFMCSVNNLSPGAYFLRKDIFPALVIFIKSPGTGKFTFEALLLLAVLANFHKSDAAKLNPYLKRIGWIDDRDLMREFEKLMEE